MRPVHRLTPLLRFWTGILALLAVVVVNLNASAAGTIASFLRGDGSFLPILYGVGAFLAACVAVWLGSYFWWRATGFELGEEELSLQRGVLQKQLRSARYDRIQAVDVVESIIARLFRVAAVRVETAGGKDSVIEIAYLNKRQAERLRAELIHRAGGAAPEPEQEDADLTVPLHRALAGAGLRLGSIIGVAAIVILAISPLPTATALAAVVGILPGLWRQIDSSWRFTATFDQSRHVLNLSYGLADRRRQTIPLTRIHGAQAVQPPLWRPLGWWQVTVTVAGYGPADSGDSGTSRILPVGTREQAVAVLALVSELSPAEIEEHAAPEGHRDPDFTSPRRAWVVSPVDLNRQSVTLHGDTVICHTGRFGRSVAMIATSHIQELTLRHGPLQQLLHLCTVRFDLVNGPVRMGGHDLDVEDGARLLDLLRGRRLPGYHKRV